jgi:hypothetical protein
MTAAYAADIVAWRYPPPYDVYDMSGTDVVFLTSDPAGARGRRRTVTAPPITRSG